MCQHSVFPNGEPKSSRAFALSGWTWTPRRSAASINLTSTAGDSPHAATCAAPSIASGAAAIASFSVICVPATTFRPSTRFSRPALTARTVEQIQSSGKCVSAAGRMPCSSSRSRPPR